MKYGPGVTAESNGRGGGGDADDDDDDDDDDGLEESLDQEDNLFGHERTGVGMDSGSILHMGASGADAVSASAAAAGMMRIDHSTGVDEEAWLEETERVVPKLAAAQVKSTLGEGWMGHSDSIVRLSRGVASSVHGGGGYGSGGGGSEGEGVGGWLQSIVRALQTDLESLRRGEALVNASANGGSSGSSGGGGGIGAEYGALSAELKVLQSRQVCCGDMAYYPHHHYPYIITTRIRRPL
jgi:hypothetical protein